MDSPGPNTRDSDAEWNALIDHLFALARKGMVLGLDRVERVLGLLAHPEQSFESVHIAGSNGKGSTAAFLATILMQHRKVALFTSPHLESVTERLRLGDRALVEISREDFHRAIRQVEAVAPDFGHLTFFEVITIASLVAMRDRKIDVAVVEAGLGARLDATRLVPASVSILTDISVEHSAILGDTLEAIAREKVFVAREGRPLVTAGGANDVVDAQCLAWKSPVFRLGRDMHIRDRGGHVYDLIFVDRTIEAVRPSLLGAYQARNAILAAQAAVLFDPSIDDETIRTGIETAVWPGRMEWIRHEPPILLDGAHNPAAVDALVNELKREKRPLHLVFGVMGDKDAGVMLERLRPVVASLVLTQVDSARARDPRELARDASEVAENVDDALARAIHAASADGGAVVVCGSLFLVGVVRGKLAGDFGRVIR